MCLCVCVCVSVSERERMFYITNRLPELRNIQYPWYRNIWKSKCSCWKPASQPAWWLTFSVTHSEFAVKFPVIFFFLWPIVTNNLTYQAHPTSICLEEVTGTLVTCHFYRWYLFSWNQSISFHLGRGLSLNKDLVFLTPGGALILLERICRNRLSRLFNGFNLIKSGLGCLPLSHLMLPVPN